VPGCDKVPRWGSTGWIIGPPTIKRFSLCQLLGDPWDPSARLGRVMPQGFVSHLVGYVTGYWSRHAMPTSHLNNHLNAMSVGCHVYMVPHQQVCIRFLKILPRLGKEQKKLKQP
jgi:hypothetical protein